jgi:hypothetical protein
MILLPAEALTSPNLATERFPTGVIFAVTTGRPAQGGAMGPGAGGGGGGGGGWIAVGGRLNESFFLHDEKNMQAQNEMIAPTVRTDLI